METHVVDHVLNDAKDILILLGEADLEGAVDARGRLGRDGGSARLRVGICRGLSSIRASLAITSGFLGCREAPLGAAVGRRARAILLLGWIAAVELHEVQALLVAILLVGIHLGEHGVHHLGQRRLGRVSIHLGVGCQVDGVLRLEGLHQRSLVHLGVDGDRDRE